MIQKKLEKDSKYSYLDVDGDGIVDDDEMRLHDMEMQDRKKMHNSAN